MKMLSFSVANLLALLALVSAAPASAFADRVDQSQLNTNTALPIDAANLPIGQSFQAGISGVLTHIDIFPNGEVVGGNNTLALSLYSGSGFSGKLLASGMTTVASTWDVALQSWLIDINTVNLNTQIAAGQEYAFAITKITGTGSLDSLGLLGNAGNPYLNGQAFSGANPPSWDLAFQTQVNTVPISSMFWLSAMGFIGITHLARKHRATE